MLSFLMVTVFFTTFLILYFILNYTLSPRLNVIKRMQKISSMEVSNASFEDNETKSILSQAIVAVGFIGKIVPKNSYMLKQKTKLLQASVLIKAEEFVGISVLLALVSLLMCFLATNSVLISIVFMVPGYLLPDFILSNRRTKRMAKLNMQLPEALGIITNGIRAGVGTTQAMKIVTEEVTGPVSVELKKVLRENSLGKPIEVALLNMAERTSDDDIDMVVAAFIIQKQVGGNLATVLDSISHTIRERARIKGEVRVLTSQGKMSAIIVSLLPVALAGIFSIINPSYLEVLYTTTIGRVMLLSAIVLELIGIFILVKMTNIKV